MNIAPEKLKLYRDIFKPLFSVWLLYVIAFSINFPIFCYVRVRQWLNKIVSSPSPQKPLLCLEAGEKGWEIIEYKELYQSALEYMGEGNLVKFVISPDTDYVQQLKELLKHHSVTHYGWSPRTGDQHWFKGLIQTLRVSIIFHQRGVIPIVFLTDVLDRSWRTKASIISSICGVVVTLNSPNNIKLLLPHKRFIGPYIMPFSCATIESLHQKKQNIIDQDTAKEAVVVGALYEPRKTIVENVNTLLLQKGLQLTFYGRLLDGKRSTDEQYWSNMLHAKIVLTTANVVSTLDGYDWSWNQHFIYRYMEVLACETLLLAPNLPSIQRYFVSGVHFVAYCSEADAAEKIEYFLENDEERKAIARAGYLRAQSLVISRHFWLGLDTVLTDKALTL